MKKFEVLLSSDIYNNGFVVKSLCDDPYQLYPPLRKDYRGIGRFMSWPLRNCDDHKSRALEDEAWGRWFCYQNILEVVPEIDFLKRYINQCNDFGIETITLMVETPRKTQLAKDPASITECLGYDLISSVDFSFLSMDTDYLGDECSTFQKTVNKLNNNGLCDTITDVYEHIKTRNYLLEQGVNLEKCDFGPLPARLSIVVL